MRFLGRLFLADAPEQGMEIVLLIEKSSIVLSAGADELGTWPIELVEASRAAGDLFDLKLGAESFRFEPRDRLSFAYEGLQTIEERTLRRTTGWRGRLHRIRGPRQPIGEDPLQDHSPPEPAPMAAPGPPGPDRAPVRPLPNPTPMPPNQPTPAPSPGPSGPSAPAEPPAEVDAVAPVDLAPVDLASVDLAPADLAPADLAPADLGEGTPAAAAPTGQTAGTAPTGQTAGTAPTGQTAAAAPTGQTAAAAPTGRAAGTAPTGAEPGESEPPPLPADPFDQESDPEVTLDLRSDATDPAEGDSATVVERPSAHPPPDDHPPQKPAARVRLLDRVRRSREEHVHSYRTSTISGGLVRRVCTECHHVSIGVDQP